MMIGNILRNKPQGIVSIAPDMAVLAVSALMAEKNIGAVLVLDQGRLVGILSERDVVRSLASHGAATLTMTAADLMTPDPTTAAPETTVEQAMAVMTERHFRHLPVMDNGTLAGVVSIGDVVKARIDQSQYEVETLRTYVGGRV
jgi:CBS domain-containing protein